VNSLVDSTVSPYTRNGGRLDEIPRIVTAEMNPVLEPIPNYISGTSSLETIPNYIPGSDPGVTPLIASDRGFLRDLIKFGPGENPDAGYDHWLLEQQKNKIFRNDPTNIAMTPASPGTGEQRMAGMNPILKTIVQYWNDLNSGKYNYTKYEDNDYMGNHAAPFNPLETKWNYRNMQNTLNGL